MDPAVAVITAAHKYKPKTPPSKRKTTPMSLFKSFKTDPKAEKEGIEVNYGTFKLRLARIGGANTDFAKRYEELMKPYRRVPKDQLAANVTEKIVTTVFTETVIKPNSWQTLVDDQWVDGIQDENDEVVSATPENVAKVLLALPDLYQALFKEASNLTNFLAEGRAEDAKNS